MQKRIGQQHKVWSGLSCYRSTAKFLQHDYAR